MRIAVGADHAGVGLKDALVSWLRDRGEVVTDLGTHGNDSVDYPDFAQAVAREVAGGAVDRGILVCGSGIGMAIAANKVPGIRAAVATERESAFLSRSHNDANILALGARLTSDDTARELVTVFLETPYEGGRHQRRVDKIHAIEQDPT